MTKYNFGAKRLWIATVAMLALGAAVTGTIAGQRDNTRETTIRQVSSLDLLTRIPPNSVFDRDVVLVEAEGALYRFDADSTATADGVTIVSPLGGAGRWYLALAKVTGHEPSVVAATVLNPTGLGTPTYGQRWLIAGTGAGGWASQSNKIAQYVTGTKTLATSWRFIAPGVGSLVTSTTTGLTYQKASGGTWVGLDFAVAAAANAMLVPATAGTGAQLVLAEPTGGGASTLTFEAPALGANRTVSFGDDSYAMATIKTGATAGSAAKVVTDEMLDVAGAAGGTLTLLEPVAGGGSAFTMAAPALAAPRAITLGDEDYDLSGIKAQASNGNAAFAATDEMLDVAGASGGTLTLLEPVAGGILGFTMAAPALAAARAITLTDRDYNLTTIADQADLGVTNAATAQATADAAVPDAAFTSADGVLVGSGAGTYAELVLGPSTILAKLAAGGAVAATPTELRTLINVADGADVTVDALLAALAAKDALEGLTAKRVARYVYDFAVEGGAISTINLGGTAMPAGSLPVRSYVQVVTPATSGGAATMQLRYQSAAGPTYVDIIAAAPYNDATWSGPNEEGLQLGTAATFGSAVQTGGQVELVIAGATLTAGKFAVFIEYVRGTQP